MILVKKIWKKFSSLDTFAYLAVSVMAFSLILLFAKYSYSLVRLKDACVTFGKSVAYYALFVWHSFRKTENPSMIEVDISRLPSDAGQRFPFSLTDFSEKFSAFGKVFWNLDSFSRYNLWLFERIYDWAVFLSLFVPCIILLFMMIRTSVVSDKGKKVGAFSAPLIHFLKIMKRIWRPFFQSLCKFLKYFSEHKPVFYGFLLIWVLNLNLLTVGLELLGFYFYFISSFDFLALPGFVFKVFLDLTLTFFGLPLIFWAVLAVWIYCRVCMAKGYAKLRHMDARNCGFLKEVSYVSLLIGSPGVGKTTLLTSFCLYFVNIFKRMALDSLYDIELLFPGFPFGRFRLALNERIRSHLIYTIPSCDLYVDELQRVYERTPSPCELFGYDFELFSMDKDVGHRVVTLFSALRTYARAYFVYVSENPSVSNYPIRFDGSFDESPYFPMWDGDFYSKKPRQAKEKSRYAHILDQDILRQGKHMEQNNPNVGCFSFGIWSNSEWGKCRGNQITTADLDKSDSEANQKNDLYAYSHKMARHANTTIDHKVYFRFIGDEQRPQSLAADQRDLCDVLSILEKSELKLALPGFGWLDSIYEKIYEPFKNFYLEYAGSRGDMILSVFLLKMAVSGFSWIYRWIYNRFGYYTLKLAKEKGTVFGEVKAERAEAEVFDYHLSVMQIYSDRYSTDCYSGFFTKKQLECELGINDLACYAGLSMSEEEMDAQHDYFLEDIKGMMQKSVGEEPKSCRHQKKKDSKESFEPDFEVQKL